MERKLIENQHDLFHAFVAVLHGSRTEPNLLPLVYCSSSTRKKKTRYDSRFSFYCYIHLPSSKNSISTEHIVPHLRNNYFLYTISWVLIDDLEILDLEKCCCHSNVRFITISSLANLFYARKRQFSLTACWSWTSTTAFHLQINDEIERFAHKI